MAEKRFFRFKKMKKFSSWIKDLEKRGHEVWFDQERLKPGKDWEIYIEEGLNKVAKAKENGKVICLMTPHSVRRPEGYCLNELARAITRKIKIIPIII